MPGTRRRDEEVERKGAGGQEATGGAGEEKKRENVMMEVFGNAERIVSRGWAHRRDIRNEYGHRFHLAVLQYLSSLVSTRFQQHNLSWPLLRSAFVALAT